MLDIDRFKPINDDHGHAIGDLVLKETVIRLNHELRPTDVLARIGGEEFVILLPECDESYAFEVAERLRAAIARMPITTATGISVPVTISIGIAVHHPPDSHSDAVGRFLQAAMRQADRNLYRAKKSGRNRIASSTQP